MADLTSKQITNGQASDAAQYNVLLGSILRADWSNAVTMAGTVTLADADFALQRFDCNGANRIVKLPAYGIANHPFFIINTTAATYTLDVQSNAGASLLDAPLMAGKNVLVLPDGAAGYKVITPRADGWTPSYDTWSYSSADSPSFVISIPADVTGILGAGDRIQLTQTTVKYFIVTAVGAFAAGATLVTVYGGTDYTLANAAITLPYYSHAKAPFGFPLNPAKWMQSATVTDGTQASAVQNTWYNIQTGSISIPIGIWRVMYFVVLANSSVGAFAIESTLSTANNSESDTDFTARNTPTAQYGANPIWKEKYLALAAKTTYYLNERTITTGTPTIGIGPSTKIYAVCALL